MIIGHRKQWQVLERMAQSGKIPHAILFCGPEGLGKKKMAEEFLELILKGGEIKSADIVNIGSEEGEIQISQIRELNWKMSLKPLVSEFKAAIIDNAHLMNQEAQNCLLKTLEEPKGNTVIILVAEFPERLLSTIRSRVQKVKFYPVVKKEIEGYLEKNGMQKTEIKIVSEIAAGRPGIAVNFLNDPEKISSYKQKIKEISALLDSDIAEKFRYAKELPPEELKENLTIWLNYFRNIFLSKMNLAENWVVLKKDYTIESLKNILNSIQNTIFTTASTNVNKRLAMEILLMEI